MSGHVHTQRQGAVLRVILRHPAKFNAMSRAMWRELRQVFESLPSQTAVRCVLVQGEGGHFCAGGDISEYPDFRFTEDGLRDFHENDVWGALSAMLQCDIPIVAQIEGHCMGAGVEMACCCDIRIAAPDAKFGAPIARLGFPMAPREAALVLREAGAVTAREMLLEAAVLGADTLWQRGFLSRVAQPGHCAQEAAAAAGRIVALAPQAARLNKQTLRALNAPDVTAPVLPYAYAYADSPEHREGISAFLEKRASHFSTPET